MAYNNSKVVIIGAGPAGIACAIQLARYNINTVIIEKNKIGGLSINANLIENYLGFPKGISGEKYVQLIINHVKNLKIDIKYETAEIVDYVDGFFKIKTNKNNHQSEIIVIASGTKPIVPKVPSISGYVADKVFFEIQKIRDVKNKTIAIIGAGDCAYDYALSLCINNKVIILNRSKKIKALPILHKRALQSRNISYYENTTVIEISEKQDNLVCASIPKKKIFTVNYLLIAIGREPEYSFINSKLFNIDKLYRIGDVNNEHYRQISIASGDGTITAMKINNILNGRLH